MIFLDYRHCFRLDVRLNWNPPERHTDRIAYSHETKSCVHQPFSSAATYWSVPLARTRERDGLLRVVQRLEWKFYRSRLPAGSEPFNDSSSYCP